MRTKIVAATNLDMAITGEAVKTTAQPIKDPVASWEITYYDNGKTADAYPLCMGFGNRFDDPYLLDSLSGDILRLACTAAERVEFYKRNDR